MSAEKRANHADELWARARRSEHRGSLKDEASELLKRANSVLDAESLKLFGLFLIRGLIGENASDAAVDLACELSDDVRIEAQRIIAGERGSSAGASESSRRAAAKRALADLDNVSGGDLDDHLLDFCKLRQRAGDTVTGMEMLALQRRFRVAIAAREAKTPSYADLNRALTEIRRSAG